MNNAFRVLVRRPQRLRSRIAFGNLTNALIVIALGSAALASPAEAQERSPVDISSGRLVEEITEDLTTNEEPVTTWSVVDERGHALALDGMGFDPLELANLSGHEVAVDTAARSITSIREAPALRTANGQHDLAVILIDATANGPRPFDRAEIANRMFNNNETLNRYFLETSYGQVSFTGDIDDVYGWLVPDDVSYVAENCFGQLYYDWVTDMVEAEGISVADYEHVLLLFNCDVGGGGASTIGPRNTTVGGELCACSTAYVAGDPALWGEQVFNGIAIPIAASGSVLLNRFEAVVGHELGHSLGGPHDGLVSCGPKSWDVAENCLADSNYWVGNYGNFFSILGRGRGNSWGFSAAMRHFLGWLDDSRLLMIDEGGTYSVGPLAIDDASQPQAAAIIDPGTGEIEYFVELRIPFGFDADHAHAQPGNDAMISTLRERPGLNPRRPQLIDGQPNQPGTNLDPDAGTLDAIDDNGFHNGDIVGFLPGTGFTDEFGLSITIDEVDATNQLVTFTVSMPGDPGTAGSARGDVNCDGIVTVADAAAALQAAVGLRDLAQGCPLANPATEIDAQAADLDDNGFITVLDATGIMQCAVTAGAIPC